MLNITIIEFNFFFFEMIDFYLKKNTNNELEKNHYKREEVKVRFCNQEVQLSQPVEHLLEIQKNDLFTTSSKIVDFLGKSVPKTMQLRKFYKHKKLSRLLHHTPCVGYQPTNTTQPIN